MKDFAGARASLVRRLMDEGLVRSPRVAVALREVPREAFLPLELARHAYDDQPLDIGEGQTISAPHMVAIMAEALDLVPGMRVLEVGGGSGYHAAVYAEMVAPGERGPTAPGRVHSVERIPLLARRAEEALRVAGYGDVVEVEVGDGSLGLPSKAPFDRVSVACAAPAVPPPLVEQLASGGRLLVPVGDVDLQELLRVTKHVDGTVDAERLGPCRFVPLRGAHGFR